MKTADWYCIDIVKKESKMVEKYICINHNCDLHCRIFVKIGNEPTKCLEEVENETISQMAIQMD